MSNFLARSRVVPALAAAAAAALVLAGCTSPDDDVEPISGSVAPESNPQVAFVAALMTATYFQVMQCGAEAAAADHDVDLDWQGDANWDLQTQTPLINAAMQLKPDGLIMVPTDPTALVGTVEKISNDGIPVITVDGSLDEEVELQNIRTDNLTAGALAADALAESIDAQGTVMVVASYPGVSANAERVDGFTARMAEQYPDITVLPTEYAESDQSKAAQKVSAALANPDLKGVYTTLAPASAGAAAAIEGSGKVGEVKLVAYDADPSQVEALKNGVYEALVAQDPYGLGYDSVERIAKVIRGESDGLEYQDYVQAFIITADNVDSEQAHRHIYTPTC